MKKIILNLLSALLVTVSYGQIINISTGLGIQGQPDTWTVSSNNLPLTTAKILSGIPGQWQSQPLSGTNAKWISILTNCSGGNGQTEYTYEKSFTVNAGSSFLNYNFKVAADDILRNVELVSPSNVITTISFVVSPTAYMFTEDMKNTISCPEKGIWKVRVKVFCADPAGQGMCTAFLLSGNIVITPGVCEGQTSAFCCPGTNLICNGDFEGEKPCFESRYNAYSQQKAFRPGEYIIKNYQDSNRLCNQWNFNQAPCQKTGKGMFVNGATNGTGSKVIWQQQVNYNGYAQYRFCAEVLPLNQCCFNVVPKLVMKLTYTSVGQQKTINLNETTTDNCGWVKYSGFAQAWEGSDGGTGTISIELDETGIGDGNDFVLDNIAFIELKPIASAITASAVPIPGIDGVKGVFNGTLPTGIVSLWNISLLDVNGNPDPNCPALNFWGQNTNFPGYNGCNITQGSTAPGKLLPGRTYKIYFATYGNCNAWRQDTWTITQPQASSKMLPVVTKDEKAEINMTPSLKTEIKKGLKSLIKEN